MPLSCAALRHSPLVRGGRARRVWLPGHTLLVSSLKYSCAILLFDLVFENVRQRVGCAEAYSPSVMGVAVEQGRFLLTAEGLRKDILSPIWGYGKLQIAPRSPGGFPWA